MKLTEGVFKRIRREATAHGGAVANKKLIIRLKKQDDI